MTTRKRALTAQIKPETRNAIMDQLAAAADEVIRAREAGFRIRVVEAKPARSPLQIATPPLAAIRAAASRTEAPTRPWWRRWLP